MITEPLALHPPNPTIPLRLVRMTDLDTLCANCWQDRTPEVGRWLLTRVERNIREKRGTGIVAVGTPQTPIIGYGQLTLWPRCAEISDLVVAEGYRGHGIGTAIIQCLMQHAIRLRADCVEIGAAEANPGAVRLYRRLGFVDDRVVLMNLGNGEREPVIFMKLPLD